jgi:transposase
MHRRLEPDEFSLLHLSCFVNHIATTRWRASFARTPEMQMVRPKLKPKDLCRLALDERLSNRELARISGASATTVGKYRQLMRIHHVDAAMLKTLSDAELIDLLQAKYKGGAKDFIEPDWDHVYREFQKANVTIALLYSEYSDSCAGKKGGAVRSEASFGRKLREHCKARGLSMRQEHLPGQEMFVDFSGKHLYLTNRETGERTPVEIFVASLGNSQLMFITAVASQKMPDWIEANVRAFEYFGGVSAMTIPDNLKSGVDKPAHRGHEARINRSYIDFAEHYGTVIVPARPLHPQDKALAEIAVRITNMWVIGQLRNHVFYSLGEMNALILPLVERINNKRSRRLAASRQELFEEREAGCLMPLPATRHEYTEWYDGVRVPKDYHIGYNRDYYSVPHHLAYRTVSYCITRSTIRIFSEQASMPVAVHRLGPGTGATITEREHMPEAHRAYAGRNVEELLAWSDSIGADVRTLFEAVIKNPRIHAVSAIRQMSNAQKLAKEYGHQRLASACRHANAVGTQTIPSVANILRMEIDLRQKDRGDRIVAKPVAHANVRGADAYKGEDE